MARHTIRITYVRQADRYRIDEMVDDVVRTELVEAVFNEAFAEHLAELVANFRQIDVTRLTIDDDGVVLEWERCRVARSEPAWRPRSPGAASTMTFPTTCSAMCRRRDPPGAVQWCCSGDRPGGPRHRGRGHAA